MTRDEILKLDAGRELDALVAEKALGWPVVQSDSRIGSLDGYIWEGVPYWGLKHEPLGSHLFKPSTDIAAAWQVVEKVAFNDQTGVVICDHCGKPPWNVTFGDVETVAETLPLAICRTALLSKVVRPLTVEEARKRNVCRICRGPVGAPFTLDYGKEFAHTKCLEAADGQVQATP